MISFYPKFGAAEDAPNYRISESEDRCENCAHYRNLGPEGYCEKFSFTCAPEYVCDDFRPAGVVKESSLVESVKDNAATAVKKRVRGAGRTAQELSRLRALRAIEEARKGGLMPSKYENAIRATKSVYPKTASDTDAFLEGLHPVPGSIVSTVAQDQLDPDVSVDDMRRRRALGMAGGALSGGVLVPGVIATGIGAARGASLGQGLRRIPAALTGARAALGDTFHRASIPALSAGAGLGALGVKAQHDTGIALANLASSKTAMSPYASFGLTGAALLGGKSLLSDKDKVLRDIQLQRRGKIDNTELKERLKSYGLAAGANALAGGALGAGSVAGFRKVVKPELMRMGDEVASYAGKKVDQASRDTLRNVDDIMTKQRQASAAEARQLANEQRAAYSKELSVKADELLDKARSTDLLEGTRKGMADSASNKVRSVKDRLSRLIPGRRAQRWKDIADGVA